MIISYSLFSSNNVHKNRTYDICNGSSDRYWFNIPAVIITNSIFYPKSKTLIHISKNLESHYLFPFLNKISQEYNNFEIQSIDYSYRNTEPTLWRLIPVWNGSDTVICRDIDSLVNESEYRSTIAFLESSYLIHNIRSHPAHNSSLTRLLAGLCGFKEQCKKYIDCSFDDFYKKAGAFWGCDQDLLMKYWIDRTGNSFVNKYFLDSPVTAIGPMAENIAGFYAGKLPKETYQNIDISHIPEIKIFNNFTSWCGQPTDARGNMTQYLINLNNECSRVIKDNMTPDIKTFFRI